MSASSPQIYHPLNANSSEIRLLNILPAPFSSQVECHMYTASINKSSQIAYRALSYVWGDESDVTNITVNTFVVPVTKSLATALRYIRNEHTAVTIWADAICINQKDFQERKQQVSKMKLIYQSAREVVAWLGEEFPESKQAMQWIHDWALCYSGKSMAASDKTDADHARTIPSGYTSAAHATLISLANRSFWSRIWILQELTLGRFTQKLTVCCGKERHPFRLFERAKRGWEKALIQIIEKSSRTDITHTDLLELMASPMTRMIQLAQDFEDPKTGRLMTKDISMSLLADTGSLEAKDPLDKVYGIMGIATPGLPDGESLEPDYTKSVVNVYTDVSRAIILRSKSLKLLAFGAVWKDSQSQIALPSWVLDLRTCVQPDSFEDILRRKPEMYSEARFQRSVRFSADHSSLHITGWRVGSLQVVYPKAFSMGDANNEFWLAMTSHPSRNGMPFLQAFFQYFRIICFRKIPQRTISMVLVFLKLILRLLPLPAEATAAARSKEEYASRLFVGGGNEVLVQEIVRLFTVLDWEDKDLDLTATGMALVGLLKDRVLFFTNQGRLGIGSDKFVVGDVIFQSDVHYFPFAVRKEQNSYKILGECLFLDSEASSIKSSRPHEEIEIR